MQHPAGRGGVRGGRAPPPAARAGGRAGCPGGRPTPARGGPGGRRAVAAERAGGPGAALIDGKAIAAAIRAEVAADAAEVAAASGRAPGLAVVLVGDRKDSQAYVRSKKKACAEAGIASFGAELPGTATEAEVLAAVEGFNADPRVHGILVQLPLPAHLDEERILSAISIEKDVDGFHPQNVGKLVMQGREPLFVPCTPKGW